MKNMSSREKGDKYENITRQLLLDIREKLGLSDKLESQQRIQGNCGTKWPVDLLAYDINTDKIVLVECRYRSKEKLKQDSDLAGFAYRIRDTNADRGIIVTTIGLQEGAEKVAEYENITPIKLTIDIGNNSKNYIAELSTQIFEKGTELKHTSLILNDVLSIVDIRCVATKFITPKSTPPKRFYNVKPN